MNQSRSKNITERIYYDKVDIGHEKNENTYRRWGRDRNEETLEDEGNGEQTAMGKKRVVEDQN